MINCIKLFVKEGKIPKEIGDEMLEHIKKGESGESVINKIKSKLEHSINNHPAQKKIKEIDDFIKENPERSPIKHIKDRLTASPGEGKVFNNVEDLSQSFLHDVFHKHFKTLNSLRNKLFGNKYRKDLLERMIRVQFKEIDDVEAEAALKEFNLMNEAMHKHYVQSGGTQPIRNITLSNNAERILQDDESTFVKNVSPLVNNSEDEVKALYNKAHLGDDIEDDVLDFKGSQEYLQYAGKYGSDIFSSMMSRIKQKAVKTAFNHIFGNSDSAIQKLMRENQLNVSERREVENIVNELLGETNRNIATGKMATFSKATKGARSLAAASQLGSATISAISDLATVLVTANFNGLPVIKTFMNSLAGLAKIEDNSKILAQQGLIADNLIDDLAGATRMDVHAGTDILSITSDKVLRASGLMAWTEGLKNAWKTSHLGFLATLPKEISKMDKPVQKQFQKYGITQDVWNKVYETKDTNFVNLTKLDTDTAHIMRKYINGETHYAILEPNAFIGATMNQGFQSGTIAGETIRGITQYKSFLLAGLTTHIARVYKMTSYQDKASYTVKMALSGVTIGMFVVALKDLKNGNDPLSRDYSDPKQFMNAIAESGIGGIAVETLVQGFKGDNPLEMFSLSLAPSVGLVTKLAKAGKEFVADDKDVEEAFSDALKTVGQMVPGRNLFYAQWLTQEMGRDMLLLVNPEYQKTFDRIDRAKRAREKKDGLEELDFFD